MSDDTLQIGLQMLCADVTPPSQTQLLASDLPVTEIPAPNLGSDTEKATDDDTPHDTVKEEA